MFLIYKSFYSFKHLPIAQLLSSEFLHYGQYTISKHPAITVDLRNKRSKWFLVCFAWRENDSFRSNIERSWEAAVKDETKFALAREIFQRLPKKWIWYSSRASYKEPIYILIVSARPIESPLPR
jgi:hypothetical protein